MLGGVVKPGDQVSIGTISGEVIDMNWRSTIVRARGGRVDIIPNSVLNKTALAHRTRWDMTCLLYTSMQPRQRWSRSQQEGSQQDRRQFERPSCLQSWSYRLTSQHFELKELMGW